MTERPSQSADGSGIAQADNGATATVNYSTHHHYAADAPRPTRAVHLDPPPPLFIGRAPELKALHQHLAREGAVVYIPGFPGRGKSTLANYYAHQHKDEYQTVHWLPCHAKSLVEIAVEFAWQLELKLDGDPESNLKQLRRHCAHNRCLLILDNVDDEAPAGMLLGGRSSVLITTWHTNLKFLRRVPSVPLPVFTEEECFKLFREIIGAKDVDRHTAESRLLFERLEHHPFAIDIAASLIREDQRYTIAGMAKNLPADIPALFAEAIGTLSPVARSLLAAMAACALEGFRLSLAAEVAEFDEAAAHAALYEIRARSLIDEIDRETYRYRLHALVREAAKATDAHRAGHAEAIRKQFEGWEANRRQCEQDMADWQTAFTWSLDQPEDEAWFMAKTLAYSAYRLTYRLGRLSEAYEIYQRLALAADRHKDSYALQACYGNRALILQDWGQLDDAMALHKKEEDLCTELDDKAGLQACYGNQALILKAWGRLDDAMVLHKKKEDLCTELGDKAGLSRCYGNQALILKAWGQLDDAMALHKKEEDLCTELGDKAGLSRCYGNQALILPDWGRLDDAMALHKKQEDLCNELGDKAGLSRCYGNQALILRAWGQLDDAMALLKKQEDLCTELGDKAGLQACYGNQALILKAWGQLDDAMALHKKEEDLCTELGDKAGLSRSYGNQAVILQAWGQLDDAMALLKQKEALCIELANKNSLAYCYWNWGLLARAQDDTETERAKLEQALALFTQVGMPREIKAVQAQLDKTNANHPPAA